MRGRTAGPCRPWPSCTSRGTPSRGRRSTGRGLGRAYGVAALAALERGARVVALDVEQRQLDILAQRVADEARGRLTLTRGVLPDVDFADGRFAAIHGGRVLHFLAPDEVRSVLG